MGRLRRWVPCVLVPAVAIGGWLLLRPPVPPASTATFGASRLPAVRRAAAPWDRWTVTEQFAAQHVMVLQVETRHLDEADAIARTVGAALEARYSEILFYFHRPGRPDTLPPRRVQWTPDSGYVETIFHER